MGRILEGSLKWLDQSSPLHYRKLAIPRTLEYREKLASKNLRPLTQKPSFLVAIGQPGCHQLPAFRASLSERLLDHVPIGWTCLNVVFPCVHADYIDIPAGSFLWTDVPIEYRVVPA